MLLQDQVWEWIYIPSYLKVSEKTVLDDTAAVRPRLLFFYCITSLSKK